jgi:voltage-gated potassium channel Kch
MGWRDDLNYGLAAFGVQLPQSISIDDCLSKLKENPARNTAALVAASAAMFYAAERDHNPKVNDIYDAMVYCSTCLSVGYGDIFARTPIGKILGTMLMTIGPALSSQALDGKTDPAAMSIQSETLRALEAILAQLRSNVEEGNRPAPMT